MAEKRLEEIRAERLKKRLMLLEAGRNPYPAEAQRTHLLSNVHEEFGSLVEAQTPITVVGRIISIRRHGGLVFVDIRDGSGQLQMQLTRDDMPLEVFDRQALLDVGDFIQAAGKAGYTQRGMETLMVAEMHLLTKSIRPLPSAWHGLKDHEARWRQRDIDLFINDEAKQTLITRAHIIQWLRQYFIKQGYLEVETPILQSIPGGAAARPFETHHNALDIPLYLRISAELYLKRLLAAGFEKVFEIERRFRNEGIDKQHNPEFTMLESQLAYADYEDLMDFTETILQALCLEVVGSTDITWGTHQLSFAAPLPRVRYIDLMSEALGFDVLTVRDLAPYKEVFNREKLELPESPNYYHLLDEYYKERVRPTIIQPTLVYDYPLEMAPLAKASSVDPRVAEKFQLVAAGLELNNCYSEQNDPVLQHQRFIEQQAAYEAGDVDAQKIDQEYLRSMEYGMPPNAGWSLGIDRFVMLVTNSPSIRDTLAFPLLRPEE